MRPTGLFVAAFVSLIGTAAASYAAREELIEANWWVTHTDEVRLAVADGKLAIAQNDLGAVRAAEWEIERLTIDNVRQQRNVTRASMLTSDESLAGLDELFTAMDAEEDRLRLERAQSLAHAQLLSSSASIAGIVLTFGLGLAGTVTLRRQRRELARQGTLIASIVENVAEGIVAVDVEKRTVTVNAAARKMLGGALASYDDLDAWDARVRVTYEDGSVVESADTPMARALRGETTDAMVLELTRVAVSDDAPPSKGRWVSTTARPVIDADGQMIAAVTTMRDVTGHRAANDRLRDLSLRDEMTGLLNRRGFFELAGAQVEQSHRTGANVALLFADVDGLKWINDVLGHDEGDRAITEAAHVLRNVLRDSDVVARLGGDEFVALLPSFSAEAHEALLARVDACLRDGPTFGPERRPLSLSVGITFMDESGTQTVADLVAEADLLMYARKRRAKDAMSRRRAEAA